MSHISHNLRLQQPVQNPISDNTNILWNSPSSEKYIYRLPLVLKPSLFYLLKGKQGQTHLFFSGIAQCLGCIKTGINEWNCIVLNFNQIKA